METECRKKSKNSVIKKLRSKLNLGTFLEKGSGAPRLVSNEKGKKGNIYSIQICFRVYAFDRLNVFYDDSGKLLHRAPDGTAKIWLIRSERDYCWLPLNTVSTMLRGVDKGESRRGGRRAKRATRIFHSRQTPANAQVEKISVRRKFGLEIPTPPPNLRPPEETGPPPVFIRRRKLTLPKYVTGRVEIPIRLCIGSTERKSVDARRV